MTLAVDLPVASGVTKRSDPPSPQPAADAAREFYLRRREVSLWRYVSYSRQDRPSELFAWVNGELHRLAELRPGWDGHRAKSITESALYSARLVLSAVLQEDSVPPQIFPLPDGGIQVEWYADDEIEIEIDGSGAAHVLATSASGDMVAEGVVDPHLPGATTRSVARFLKELSAKVVAERRRA